MAEKNRSTLLDYSLYLVVRILVCVLQTLSWTAARRVAEALSWLVYKVDKRHREVALENLRQAFPGKYTEQELDQMVRAVFRHFCTLVVEIVLLPRKLNVYNYKRHINFVKQEGLVKALLSDRPVIMLTCHFGNWELASYFLGMSGCRSYAVARTLDNPYLDHFLRKFRENTGQTILSKKGDFDKMMKVLAEGGILATLGDQDAGKRGLFVDFFGRPASTHKAIALMALQQQAPVVVAGTFKVAEPACYHIVTEDVIYPETYQEWADAVPTITQRFTEAFERLILNAPEQYFWLHNRWKHQPAKSRKRAA